MVQKRVDVRTDSAAAPERVYALLADGSSWPAWSPIRSFELAEPGPDAPEGVGAIRVFRTRTGGRTMVSTERVEELVPGRRLSYSLVRGLNIRGYRAYVDLIPHERGTTIHWHSSFTPMLPGTGWLYRAVLQRFIGQCARGLAGYAARPRQAQS